MILDTYSRKIIKNKVALNTALKLSNASVAQTFILLGLNVYFHIKKYYS